MAFLALLGIFSMTAVDFAAFVEQLAQFRAR